MCDVILTEILARALDRILRVRVVLLIVYIDINIHFVSLGYY